MADEHVTLAEAATLLGFPPRTVERWVLSGHLTGTVGKDGQLRLSRQEVERMVGWQGRGR